MVLDRWQGRTDMCNLCSIHTKFGVGVWLLCVYDLFDCHGPKSILAVSLHAVVSFDNVIQMWDLNTFETLPEFS